MAKRLPTGPRRCNCFVWAKLRQWRHGGFVASRQSRHFRWLKHYLWSKDGMVWWSYSPANPKHDKRALMHGLWFRGCVIREVLK